jgi:flavin-dependent dehydrogenase
MGDTQYDVAVVGAGPAGVAAALLLAKAGCEVVLVDRADFPRPVPCTGWLNSRSAPLLKELGFPIETLKDRTFREVTLFRADFSQSAKPVFQEPPGFLIDRTRFDDTMIGIASKRGITVLKKREATDLQLKESCARVKLSDGQWLTSRLLVIAGGRGTTLPERAGFRLTAAGVPYWSALVESPLDAGPSESEPRVGVVLGLDQRGSFGFSCVGKDRVSVCVHWTGERSNLLPALHALCLRLWERSFVPRDLSPLVPQAKPIHSPAGAALDIETHVGKHTLVIGDAGGFISAASNEGIYPAMWSAKIAAKVIETALQSTHSQDALITFDNAWRTQMADYLRSPHTDIQFLLPIIFTNQPMANRMGAAFFFGENI